MRVSYGGRGPNSQGALTPRLHLLCADVDELLDLVGRHLFARPRLLPARLGGRSGLGRRLCGLLLVLGGEDIFEEGHGGRAAVGREGGGGGGAGWVVPRVFTCAPARARETVGRRASRPEGSGLDAGTRSDSQAAVGFTFWSLPARACGRARLLLGRERRGGEGRAGQGRAGQALSRSASVAVPVPVWPSVARGQGLQCFLRAPSRIRP